MYLGNVALLNKVTEELAEPINRSKHVIWTLYWVMNSWKTKNGTASLLVSFSTNTGLGKCGPLSGPPSGGSETFEASGLCNVDPILEGYSSPRVWQGPITSPVSTHRKRRPISTGSVCTHWNLVTYPQGEEGTSSIPTGRRVEKKTI